MPSIGEYHPQIVHFAIALLVAGVVFRWASLTGRAAFASPAALSLLLAGTLAAVAATRSGGDAHGPVERVPGSRQAVVDHEEWGERARNVLVDGKDVPAAVAALSRITVPAEDRRLRVRHGFLTADALVAAGQKDGARAVLQTLQSAFPQDTRVKSKLDAIAAGR